MWVYRTGKGEISVVIYLLRVKNKTKINRVLRNELLHIVIEAEVDHVKHAIASYRCRDALVQPTQTNAVFRHNLSNFGNSRRLLTNIMPTKAVKN